MAYVILVPDLAQRPHYCLLTTAAALKFVRVYGGDECFHDRYLPRPLLTPSGAPFNSARDKEFIKEQLENHNVAYVIAPATDYIHAENDLASGGIFREHRNVPEEREFVPFW